MNNSVLRLDSTVNKNLVPQEVELIDKEKKELKFLGSFRRKRGLRVFEYNLKKDTLKEAEMEEIASLDFKSNKKHALSKKGKIFLNKDCVYIQALNFKNAWRKINKSK